MATLSSLITHPDYVGMPFDRAMQAVFDRAGWDIDLVTWANWETLAVSSKGFGPDCAFLHWAASQDGRDGGLPRFCYDRRLCHLLASGEKHGKAQRRRVFLFSQNRTGHAGQCAKEALDIAAAEKEFPVERWPTAGGWYGGYYRSVGMEVTASGTAPYPEWLFDLQFQIYAAMFFLFGWGPRRLITHAQATSRKVDTPDAWGPETGFDASDWPIAGAPAHGANQKQLARWLEVLHGLAGTTFSPAELRYGIDPLAAGAEGQAVKVLQQTLAKHGARLLADGSFGPATESATRAVQALLDVAVDGVWGEKSARASYVSRMNRPEDEWPRLAQTPTPPTAPSTSAAALADIQADHKALAEGVAEVGRKIEQLVAG